jgi:hypothetical protein
MNEYVSAVVRLADDLYALGVSRPLRNEAIGLYMSALFDQSTEVWRRFYYHVYRALVRWPGTPSNPEAAWRLFALIDDDFGKRLFGDGVRARLRRAMLEVRAAS